MVGARDQDVAAWVLASQVEKRGTRLRQTAVCGLNDDAQRLIRGPGIGSGTDRQLHFAAFDRNINRLNCDASRQLFECNSQRVRVIIQTGQVELDFIRFARFEAKDVVRRLHLEVRLGRSDDQPVNKVISSLRKRSLTAAI